MYIYRPKCFSVNSKLVHFLAITVSFPVSFHYFVSSHRQLKRLRRNAKCDLAVNCKEARDNDN